MKKYMLYLLIQGSLVAWAGDLSGLTKQEYHDQLINQRQGLQTITNAKTMGFGDRKRSVLDVGNLVLRVSNAATYGYDRWGLNHEFPAGSMQKDGCCTYYWTMSPIVGAKIKGQPSVAVGVRGTMRDHEEEFEPLPGYDAGYVDTEANLGIAFSDKPESWPAMWPIEMDPTGTYADPHTGLAFPGVEAELGDGFPDAPCGIGIQAEREAYFVVTDNDPDEGNTFESNGVGPLNIRIDVWILNYSLSFGNDGLVFIQKMTNIGADTLKDLYIGVAGDPDTPEQGGAEWTDDYAVFIEADDPHIAEKLKDTTDAKMLENFAMVWDGDDKAEGFKTSGIGWIGLKFLECTKIAGDGTRTSYDVSSVYTFEYSMDALSDAQAYNEQLKAGIQTPHNITPDPADIEQKPYSYGPDITWVIASGPMDIAPGEMVTFTFADFMGIDEMDLIRNAKLFQSLYDNNCMTPKPPPSMPVYASARDGLVTLFWAASETETAPDPVTGNSKFEGYRIYRSTDRGKSWGKVITDMNGNPTDLYQPLAIYDKNNGISGSYPLSDPLAYFNLGNDGGLRYSYIDRSVINGYEYWYSVCAYDGPDTLPPSWGSAPVDPLEVPRAKNAFIAGDHTVAVIPQDHAAGYEQGSAEITHTAGFSDAALITTYTDPVDYTFSGIIHVTDNDFVSKGHTYEVTFHVLDSTTNYWTLVDLNQGDTLITLENDLTGSIKYMLDGFIPLFENAVWSTSTFDTAYVTVDADTSTSILFGGVGGGGSDNTWYGFLKSLSDAITTIPPPVMKPDPHGLQLDLELRFTPEGSYASYYNAAVLVGSQPIDTLKIPFEIWTVDESAESMRLDVAVYQVAGYSKPATLWERDTTTSAAYKFTTNFQYLPIYRPYDPAATYHFADSLGVIGWVLKLNKDNTRFEFGNILRINFVNPLFPGEDKYEIATTPPDFTVAQGDLDRILVVPNPYKTTSVYETNVEVKEIQFTRLPDVCVIRIYNIAGELVKIIHHAPGSDGYRGPGIEAWDLRTYNDQEISFGVYVFHVMADKVEKTGKFAVIK